MSAGPPIATPLRTPRQSGLNRHMLECPSDTAQDRDAGISQRWTFNHHTTPNPGQSGSNGRFTLRCQALWILRKSFMWGAAERVLDPQPPHLPELCKSGSTGHIICAGPSHTVQELEVMIP